MLNNIVIQGRFTRDPEIRTTQTGTSVASFTLAVDRDFVDKESRERQTDFINCVAWRTTADFVKKYFQKGSMAIVTGRLQVRQYQDKDGNKRTATEVIVENIYFGESKHSTGNSNENGGNTSAPAPSYPSAPAPSYPSAPAESSSSFIDLDDDDGELPF